MALVYEQRRERRYGVAIVVSDEDAPSVGRRGTWQVLLHNERAALDVLESTSSAMTLLPRPRKTPSSGFF
jgi:hypothetical protein